MPQELGDNGALLWGWLMNTTLPARTVLLTMVFIIASLISQATLYVVELFSA